MCSWLNSKPCSRDSEMDEARENKRGVSVKKCSKLLELAATDDLAGFIHEVEEMGSGVNEVSYWYGRRFGSTKMGFEERTPLMIASLYGSLEVLKFIIGTGKADVNKACGLDGATPLHCAAASGSWASIEVVRILIDAFGDVNAFDANGKKPCDLVPPCVKISSGSKRKTLEMLLKGIKIEDSDEEGGNESVRTPKEGGEKKEYPIDTSLPDLNIGVYGSDDFRMYTFKVKPCSRAYSHDWTECPFVHPGENARRRDLRKHNYTCVPCPDFKKGSCAKGDSCEYAHGVFESWLHPAQYRTRLCKDETGCARKVCFFAHKPEELRPVYASTGSAMPSPNSISLNSTDMTIMSPLSLGSAVTPPLSPILASSSPMAGSMWLNKANLAAPPALQLPGSRLKTTLRAKDMDLEVELEKILAEHQRQQLDEEIGSLSSPYTTRINHLKPTNLDSAFGSLDHSLLSQLQSYSTNPTQIQSLTSHQIRQNTNQLRASYPSNAPRKQPSAYGFDSSAAVAAAVLNSRSSAFSKRSQSFVDRSVIGHRNSTQSPLSSNFSNWSSPDGKLEWGINDEEVNKLRKSASFGFRSNGTNIPQTMEADRRIPNWMDQLYIEPEQLAA